MKLRVIWCVLFLASASLVFGSKFASPVSAATDNPIVTENQHPGSDEWELWRGTFRVADDTRQQIKGYASATSVNKGESIIFHVTVNPVQAYTIDIYRMGWYQGKGGRLLQHIGPLSGVQQPTCPVDTTTGLLQCNWSPSYALLVPDTWTSGIYLALLTNSAAYQNYIIFVVRDDGRVASLLYQQSVTTYQAYNNYPDNGKTGKSLYDYNSYGANTVAGSPRAVKVSFDRPYTGGGDGQFRWGWEFYFVRWLERSGYDVSYSTNVDTHANGGRLLKYKGFLSVGHDEYWSKQMYDAAESARDAGVNLAFFGANGVYWQIRFEPSSVTAAANRIITCYKSVDLDPVPGPTTTVEWRDPYLNRAEQSLVGVQYTAWLSGSWDPNVNFAYTVINSSHWIYAGTGFRDGDSVPGMVGYEVDRYMSEYPLPSYINNSYALLSHSPVIDTTGAPDYSNSSIYQAPSGAWVFAAGTISWSWALDMAGVVDPRIQQTTANILNRFVSIGVPAAPSGLSATASLSQINLSWTDNATNEDNFVLERSTSGTFASVTSVTLSANATTFGDTGLSASTTYYYRVKAVNAGGSSAYSNTATATTSGATTPPDTTLTATPPALSNSTSASFSFTATEAGSAFECQLDSGGFATCTSPKTYSSLAQGSHTFQVRATDSAGNVDPTPASYTWTVDAVPPDTNLTATPPAATNSASASFSFSATDLGSTFQCSLDGAAFLACTSPKTYSSLAQGSHTFQVRATDAAGNVDPTPASYTWTVDTTPPVISNVRASSIKKTSASVGWTTNEAADSQVEYGTSTSFGQGTPLKTTLVTSHSERLSGLLANTTYYYRVKSQDAAGNLAVSGTFTFKTR